MSHFYGTLKGSRGKATRCGTKNSGMNVVAASWEGAVEVEMYRQQDMDCVRISVIPWGDAHFPRRVIFDGLLAEAIIGGHQNVGR